MSEKIIRQLADYNVTIGDYVYSEAATVDGVNVFETNQVAIKNNRTGEHRIVPRDDVWRAAQKDETLLTYFIAKEFADSKATSEFVPPEVAKSLSDDVDKWKTETRKWESRTQENFRRIKELEHKLDLAVKDVLAYEAAQNPQNLLVEFTDEQKSDFEKHAKETEENLANAIVSEIAYRKFRAEEANKTKGRIASAYVSLEPTFEDIEAERDYYKNLAELRLDHIKSFGDN